MRFLYYLSDSMIPFVIVLVAGYGLLQKVDIFDAFIDTMGFRNAGVRMDLQLDDQAGSISAVTKIISDNGGNITPMTLYGDGELVVRISEDNADVVVKALTDAGFLKK